jgi:ribonuclease HII
VVVAAVILEPGSRFEEVNDSKLMTSCARERVMKELLRRSVAWGIGAVDADEIDRINILRATRMAMKRAMEALPVKPDHLLIDALEIPEIPIPQTSLVGGDRRSVSVAAASVLAKVVRDRVMDYFDRRYPGYGFASHKGYGTAEHLAALASLGPCPIHRRTFKGVWYERMLPFGAVDPMSRGDHLSD